MTGQPANRQRSPRPQDMRSAMRRLLWAIVGATTFTVLMLYSELLCRWLNRGRSGRALAASQLLTAGEHRLLRLVQDGQQLF